jgi:hypothetical protein
MANVIHVNTPKGQILAPSEISKLVDRVGKKNLVALFGAFDMDASEANQMYQDTHSGVGIDEMTWGAEKGMSGELEFKRNVLNSMKKTYDRKFAGTQKVLTSISAAVFIPVLIAPEVVDIVAKKMPFLAMLQKKPMNSQFMRINRRATDQISNIDYTTDTGATLVPIDQAYTKIDIEAKLLFVAGQVTHFLQSASQETLDIYAREIEDHFIDMQGFKEKAFLTGEIAATGTYAGHFTVANGDDGIIKRIESGFVANFTALTTQSINVSHFEKIAENIMASNGEISAYICDRSTFTRIRSLAKDFKVYSENDINMGFPGQNFSFDGTPVYPSNFMSRTSGERAVVGFDINALELRELLTDTLFEAAQDLSPSKKFFFEWFGTFVVTAPEQCSTYVNGV